MTRLAILDQDGKVLSPKDVASAADLLALVEQARKMIRDCELVARQHGPKNQAAGTGQIPYLS